MNKMLKSIMINKITKFAKKDLLLLESQMSVRKKNRNDFEILDWKNTHNIKAKKKQNSHNNECKCDKNLWSCFAHSIFSQFEKKKNFKLNNSMNEKLFEKMKIINNFWKKKRNK